jgi:hypothetical protein
MFAKVIKDNTIINHDKMLKNSTINRITLISDLMNIFSKDNPQFDGKKFIEACAVEGD